MTPIVIFLQKFVIHWCFFAYNYSTFRSQDQQLSIDEVCTKCNLNPVPVEYSEEDFQNWMTYRMFSHQIRPMIIKENPKVAMAKVVQLLSAMWREFLALNPYRDQIERSTKRPKEKEGRVNKIVNNFRQYTALIEDFVFIII